MGFTNKKWFALGLVGTFIAAGGAVAIIIGSYGLMMSNRLIDFSIQSMFSMFYILDEIDSGLEGFYLIELFFMLNRYNRMRTIFRIPFFLGICLCVVGGTIALIGWIKYIKLEQSEKY